MCSQMNWHDYGLTDQPFTVPDSQRRVLVAQDDGYIEIGYWDGARFHFDYPTLVDATIPRVRYWCDLPETPTEGGDTPF
jgi:hypothetical protein